MTNTLFQLGDKISALCIGKLEKISDKYDVNVLKTIAGLLYL